MKSEKRNSEKGFSLAEVALYLSLFGLILSIALPAYVSYQIQKSNSAAKTSVISQRSLVETADASDETETMVVGCSKGGSKGYMYSAATGATIEFPLSTGRCAPGGIEG